MLRVLGKIKQPTKFQHRIDERQYRLILAPCLVELFNRSLLTGSVPAAFKDAYVTTRLKKADFDPSDTKSYRPISNLSVLSKLLERLVARQLLDYLTTEKLLRDLSIQQRQRF